MEIYLLIIFFLKKINLSGIIDFYFAANDFLCMK